MMIGWNIQCTIKYPTNVAASGWALTKICALISVKIQMDNFDKWHG